MRTVSSVCATGSLTALASIGLTVARREQDCSSSDTNTTRAHDMATSVATYAHHTDPLSSPVAALDNPFSLRPPGSRRYASEGDYAAHSKRSAPQQTYSSFLTPAASFTPGMDPSLPRDGESGQNNPSSNTSAPPTRWLRRLSTGLSTSRDSSRAPTLSRPASAAYTSGSQTLSHSGSTTPIFGETTSSPLPPNKLVKRPTSLRSASSTPSSGPGSRLPLPIFRRPATSHQRSATLQGNRSHADRSDRMSLDGNVEGARDEQWRHYFTPRIAADDTRRRHSTGIPNPIRRVYPDRKYIPTLVSAGVFAGVVTAELDDEASDGEDAVEATRNHTAPSTASSPLPPQQAHFEEAASPRRSFSIGDLLATGPSPLWRRPSSSKTRPWSSRSLRRSRPRVASEPHAPMGNSNSAELESERPTKRRDLTDPQSSRRSLYSLSGSNNNSNAAAFEASREINLGLDSDSPYVQYTPDDTLLLEASSRAQAPSPLEIGCRPTETLQSASSQHVRTSATHSEIASSVDSDSEYRSVGDNSTDYQSDAQYDSIQTQTTRSSFGRRGPHIEKIFDDSPPTFSSGRSTKLRDFLSDGQFSVGEHNGRYRHSTIEEEESVMSTPVRSLRNKSVTSTPSAHPHASHFFASSPPSMRIMADPDEIDWDAKDEHDSDQGLGIRPQTSLSTNGSPTSGALTSGGLAVRFGPTLLPSTSRTASSTPQRNGLSPTDKTNVFDWSEHNPSPSHSNQSPPRPKTVHGKKDQEMRGSRPAGRRPTSGMHARSHSVPVVPDVDGKRHSAVANKFGTWGVGSKAVTEDWDDDFDFPDMPPLPNKHDQLEEKRIDSGHEMFVPQAIREQQENVVANIGLLREWGLLIEELKELRIRAVAINMLHGPYSQAWREVDAMIELADQESEEKTLEPRKSPPSSPGFDISGFEDTLATDATSQSPYKDTADSGPGVRTPQTSTSSTSTATVTRPRKDSELVAQSVIAALQSRRNGASGPSPPSQAAGHRKVPFDTATLRHIVPYVSGLRWQVKEALRETEGLNSSPQRRTSPDRPNSEPPRNGDVTTYDELTTIMQTRRERAETDHDGSESHPNSSLTKQMQGISLPS